MSELAVTELGSGNDLVVFVHGVFDRGSSFDRVAARLDGSCRMLWYDRRGYASSIDAPGAPVGVDAHVDDLLAVLDGRRAVVVGHSFGGITAIGTALRAPELVSALVLYETGMAWLPGWNDTHLRAVLWSEDPEGDGMRMIFRDRYDTMTDDMRARRRREAQAFVMEERAVRGEHPPFDIAALAMPLVFGHSDTYHAMAIPDVLRTTVDDVEIVVVEGGGHNAHRDTPDAFAALVLHGLALAHARP